jgi:hypothetical protein
MLDTRYSILDTRYSILDTRYSILNTQYPASSIQHPVSSIQYPVSSIQYPASRTEVKKMNKPREIILRLVADGKITVEEADELLDAIERGKEDFFTDFLGKEQARRAGQEAAKARAKMYYDVHRPGAEGRARQDPTRARARVSRPRRRGTEFNFPWQETDWQWPWNNPDWQWPWESPDWKWPWDKPDVRGPASTLEVPEEAQLKIRADGGDLSIRSTDGELLRFANPRAANIIGTEDKTIHISSQGHDLGIEVPAKVISMEIALKGGDLKVQDLKSELAANVDSGDMDISRATGNIQASVDGGDIHLADIESREVEARTDNGDIYLNILPAVEEGSIVLSSESGDISLFLPPDSRCQISASAPGGEISHNLPPESVESADEAEKNLSAKLDDGGADIVLSTETGDISIKI